MKRRIFSVFGWVLIGAVAAGMVIKNAGATVQVPSFPSCEQQIQQPGDRAHYDYGWHQIVGENGLREGSDDVYSLGEGNFGQCYCPVQGTSGIQTDWWKANGLSQNEIDGYTANGWYHEQDGLQWNLENSPYLARNSNFSCGGEVQPTPTPTSEISPTLTPTPEITATPTPTPTVVPAVGGASASNSGPAAPPHCPDAQLQAPVLMSVTKNGKDGVDLVWLEVKDADYYTISYGLESGKDQYGVPNTGKVTSFQIGGLDLSKKYFFRVRAQKGCMPGHTSNELGYPTSAGGSSSGQILGLATTSSGMLGWIAGIASGLMLMSGAGLGMKKSS